MKRRRPPAEAPRAPTLPAPVVDIARAKERRVVRIKRDEAAPGLAFDFDADPPPRKR